VDIGQAGLEPVINEKTHAGCLAYPYYGLLDHGEHIFHHALYIGKVPGNRCRSTISRRFQRWAAGGGGVLKAELPDWSLQAKHTRLTVLKKAEDGHGMVVRLVEQTCRSERVCLRFPREFRKVTAANLLEEPRANWKSVGIPCTWL